MKPLVAIVGRPNVGKSMLFNKLCGQRLSIVEDTPGVTRDRLYAQCEWRNRVFDIVDTGGIEPGTDDQILSFMREQAEIAIQTATVVVFVCDVKTGMTAADQEVANMLLRARKPVVLAVNKADQVGRENPDIYEFYNLGLGDPIAVSAVHGHGTGDLLDACFQYFPPEEEEDEEDDVIKVAIIGKPNVGKSMLFNKLIGKRLSIVEDTPGVTRDRIYGESEWAGRKFRLVDTGGIEPNTDNQILAFMREQAQIAIDNADVIIFVTDIKTGLTASDQEVAGMLQRSRKPIVLAVNKMDATGTVDPDFYEFYNLGLGDPIAISAVHGHGTGDLLDACFQYLPPDDGEEEDSDVVQVAIIGKPNVGKSSLTNKILGEQRVIVSNVAGTTRDAIDSYFENSYGKYNFIDTAGMRKKSKVDDSIEKYSVLRATMAIERSDVCLILIDAQEGVTEQDTKVAGLAHDAGKACIIVVNKWDLIEKDGKTMDRMREDIRRDLSYMPYAPILFISALTGQRVSRLFELINYVNDQAAVRITTGMLNSVLADAQTRVQPPTDKGRRLKIYYMTQVGVKPPHFVIFCNDKKLFHFSYQRYLENQIRSVFGLEGTPITITIRQKGEDDG